MTGDGRRRLGCVRRRAGAREEGCDADFEQPEIASSDASGLEQRACYFLQMMSVRFQGNHHGCMCMLFPSDASCMFGFYQSSRGREPRRHWKPRRRRKPCAVGNLARPKTSSPPEILRGRKPGTHAAAGNLAADDDKRWPALPAMQKKQGIINRLSCYM